MSGSGENVNNLSVKERIAALKAKDEKNAPHTQTPTQKTAPVQAAAAPQQVSTPIAPKPATLDPLAMKAKLEELRAKRRQDMIDRVKAGEKPPHRPPVQAAATPKVSMPINPPATKTPQGPTPEQDHVKAATTQATQARMLLSKIREQKKNNMMASVEQDKLYVKPTTAGDVIIRPSIGDKDLYALYIPNYAKGTEADTVLETIGLAVLQEMKNKGVLNLKNILMVDLSIVTDSDPIHGLMIYCHCKNVKDLENIKVSVEQALKANIECAKKIGISGVMLNNTTDTAMDFSPKKVSVEFNAKIDEITATRGSPPRLGKS